MPAAHCYRWLFGLLLFWSLPPHVSAAEKSRPLTGYTLTKWTQKDGLPGTDVRRIAQTPDGYLLLSTDSGLVRFDGVRFVPVPLGSEEPAPGTGGLLVARDGSLWVGLARGGVFHIQAGFRTFYEPKRVIVSGQVRVIFEDHRGAIWVGTSSGLSRFHNNKWRLLGDQDGFPGHRVGAIVEATDGTIRIASDLGVFRWDDRGQRFVPEPEAREYCSSISQDARGTIWIAGQDHGLRPLHNADPDLIRWKQGLSVLTDRHHNLWVSSHTDGALRIGQGQTRERLTSREGLSNSFVETLFEDREGNVWIGTQDGLNRLRPTSFVPLQDPRLVDGFAREITTTQDGSLWAIVNPRIYRIKSENAIVYATPSQFQGSIFSRDGRDPLIVGSTRYLAKLSRNRFVSLKIPRENPLRSVSDLTRDSNGGLWLADYSAGLLHLAPDQLSRVPQFVGKSVRRTVVDRRDRVWVGTDEGLWRRDEGRWRHLTQSDGVEPFPISDLYLGGNGTIFAAGGNRIVRFYDDHFFSFSLKLPPGGIVSIVEDQQGALWLVHSAGIYRIAAEEWERASRDIHYELRYRQFNETDGLPALPPAIQGHFATRGRDGRLWFALRRGIVSIDPATIEENHLLPPVIVEQAIADERILSTRDSGRLPPTRSLEIDYTALSLVAPERVKFQIKLEGFDSDWIDPGTRRQVFYTNLAPGRYRFRARACNNDGIWNESGATWMFSIAPRFYQTWSFASLCALAVIALCGGAYWLRIRHLEARSRIMVEERVAERLRVARDLHDTILQNISALSLELDGLSKTEAGIPLKRQLEQLRRQAEGCMREARESVLDLRSMQGRELDLCAQLKALGQRLTSGTPVQFALLVEGRPRPMPRDVEQQVLRIGQEAIRNSVRHASANEVLAQLFFSGHTVRLCVSDNGCGFDPGDDALRSGRWGLITMRERARQIGASLKITSKPTEGTEIETTVSLISM